MNEEVALMLAFLLVALLPLAAWLRRAGSRTAVASAVASAALGGAAFSLAALHYPRPGIEESKVADRPIQIQEDGYVSSATCRACHPHQYASWHASYHRTMTQVASPDSVLGDFDGVDTLAHGELIRLERRGDEFWAELSDPEWNGEGEAPRIESRVLMTTGSHHYQVYWTSTGRDRELRPLPIVYRISEERWVPRAAVFLSPPQQEAHDETGRWNGGCVHCHATHGQPRLLESGEIDTRVAEFGITCESCHGPAEEHVRANVLPVRRYAQHLSGDPDPTIVNPENVSEERASAICGRCHGITVPRSLERWKAAQVTGIDFRAGEDLAEARTIVECCGEITDPIIQKIVDTSPGVLDSYFWSDGVVRVRGREYQGLLETPCYEAGAMSCLSCHTMHPPADDPRPLKQWAADQLEAGMDGDQGCLQCHGSYAARIEEHSHHVADSPGSRCYNCHMPFTVFGLLTANRSHRVAGPDTAESVATGRPNACNQCHLDRTLPWAAEHLEAWYGIPAPDFREDEHQIAASVLWTLRGDAGQRALMAWSLGWEAAQQASGREWPALYLAQLLTDPYAAVRFIAAASLRKYEHFRDLEYDYVGPPVQQRAVANGVAQRWAQARPRELASGSQVLLDSQGRPQWETFERLLAERDNRPLSLAE